jgi:hypothetical protein
MWIENTKCSIGPNSNIFLEQNTFQLKKAKKLTEKGHAHKLKGGSIKFNQCNWP